MERFSRIVGWSLSSTLARIALVVLPLVALAALFLSPYMTLATMSYMFLVSGLIVKGDRTAHFRLMTAAIMLDLALVLILQLQRSAVQTAISFHLNSWQVLHIICSLIAVITYIPVFYLGLNRYRHTSSKKMNTWHLRLGIAAFAFRTGGFIFMFSMIK